MQLSSYFHIANSKTPIKVQCMNQHLYNELVKKQLHLYRTVFSNILKQTKKEKCWLPAVQQHFYFVTLYIYFPIHGWQTTCRSPMLRNHNSCTFSRFCSDLGRFSVILSIIWRFCPVPNNGAVVADTSDGSGSKFFDPGRFNFLWLGSGQPFMVWDWFWKKFPLKTSNFSIISPSVQKKYLQVGSKSTRVKGRSASYLLRVKSKIGFCQGPSLANTMSICLQGASSTDDSTMTVRRIVEMPNDC